MVEWYNLYSFWVAIMCILSWTKTIKFSVMPSVIATIIGTFILLYLKTKVGKPMNKTFITIQVCLHLFPFLILPVKFSRLDVFINFGIFVMFNLWLLIQCKTFFSVYDEIVHEDGRLTLAEYAQKRGIIS